MQLFVLQTKYTTAIKQLMEELHVKTLSARFDNQTYAKIVKFRAKMAKEVPGLKPPTMSDAIRVLVEKGLANSKK